MRRYRVIAVILPLVLISSFGCLAADKQSEQAPATPDYPTITVTNDLVTMTVYTPDEDTGFYCGPRFDWSGHVKSLEYKGHSYVGQLKGKKNHTPKAHDHGSGLPEEFGMNKPLGFDEIEDGETFPKIGVGMLVKKTGKKKNYFFAINYEIASVPKWDVSSDENSVTFKQVLADDSGWGYEYTKTLTLVDGKPELTVMHQLKNTGTKLIDTDHYCHNYFIFDNRPIGKGYSVTFPFTPEGENKRAQKATLEGNTLTFLQEPLNGSFWIGLKGFSKEQDNAFTISDSETGLGVCVTTDRSPSLFNVYAEPTSLCPEPFIDVTVKPGEETTWTTTITLKAPETTDKE